MSWSCLVFLPKRSFKFTIQVTWHNCLKRIIVFCFQPPFFLLDHYYCIFGSLIRFFYSLFIFHPVCLFMKLVTWFLNVKYHKKKEEYKKKRCIFQMEITLWNEFKSCTKQKIFHFIFHLMIEFKISKKKVELSFTNDNIYIF